MKAYQKKNNRSSFALFQPQSPKSVLAGGMPSLVDGASRKDLPEAMKTKMENAFGADFSNLHIYESEKVAEGGARAVTQGNTIAFAPGEFNLYSPTSEALLGHELSHVVSQARGESRGSGLVDNAYLEAKADREGVMAAAGQQVYNGPITPISNSTPMSVAGPMQCKVSKAEKDEQEYQENIAAMNNWRETQSNWIGEDNQPTEDQKLWDAVENLSGHYVGESVNNRNETGSLYFDEKYNSNEARDSLRMRLLHKCGPELNYHPNLNIKHITKSHIENNGILPLPTESTHELVELSKDKYEEKKAKKKYKNELSVTEDGDKQQYWFDFHKSRGVVRDRSNEPNRASLDAERFKELGHYVHFAQKIRDTGKEEYKNSIATAKKNGSKKKFKDWDDTKEGRAQIKKANKFLRQYMKKSGLTSMISLNED